jgi:dimeric dUTPase (all-alpha-NTP-PPase superfamily)
MKDQILNMLELQDSMNRKVNAEWVDAGYQWYRAIWTECAEMLDHYGWKWWKHQKPDIAQVKLEVVDIWHFTLSDYLLRADTREETASLIEKELLQPPAVNELREAIEELAREVLISKSASIPPFVGLMQLCGMDFNELYRTYVGKNVLNFFRQDHGYKEGHYQKVWHGREDNEHLAEILSALDALSPNFNDEIYQALAAVYPGRA